MTPAGRAHKLSENTYVLFTSDNGGMEGHPGEVITDNYPLDKGKISAMEGGIRVPLIITGPGIRAGRVRRHGQRPGFLSNHSYPYEDSQTKG